MSNILTSKIFKYNLRPLYGDTDQMGVVYYAKYLEYFEFARNETLREVNIPYKCLEENNIYLPVSEAHLEYKNSAQYDDLLEIHCIVQQEEKSLLRFTMNCEIYKNNNLLVQGYTKHIVIGENKRPLRPDIQQREILENLRKNLFN